MVIEASWNVMAHNQKPDFVFRRNGRVHLNRPGRQLSRILAAELCGSAVVMLDTPRSEVVWRVLATYSISQFPLHFPSRTSPCAITFQLASIAGYTMFRVSVKSTGYPLHRPVSPSLPLPCVTVCHHISAGVYLLMIGLDTPETCRSSRYILRISCASSWFFYKLFYRDARSAEHKKNRLHVVRTSFISNGIPF